MLDFATHFKSQSVHIATRIERRDSRRVVVTLECHLFSFDVGFQVQQRAIVARLSDEQSQHHTSQ